MCACDIGKKCISTRWVIMEKFKKKKKIMRACLVAHGYEEDSHNLKTDSPTYTTVKLSILSYYQPQL